MRRRKREDFGSDSNLDEVIYIYIWSLVSGIFIGGKSLI